jgi:hypothetical protein
LRQEHRQYLIAASAAPRAREHREDVECTGYLTLGRPVTSNTLISGAAQLKYACGGPSCA